LILITDVDEIPDPNTLKSIKNGDILVEVSSLVMDFYYYNLNTKFSNKWTLGKIISYKKYKELNISCNEIRNRNVTVPSINNGGWHLSYFGDSNFIKNKINNFSHQEHNNDNFTNLSKIEERIKNGRDLFDRNEHPQLISIANNKYLPVDYEKYLKKYFSFSTFRKGGSKISTF
jgi:beta-1,4-mannosyl-glycoprotein beta-1,4-N-acetylglucosaminyltransferase